MSLGDSLDSLHSNTEPVMPLSDDSQINIATSPVTSPSLSSGSLGRDYRPHSSFSRGSVESCCSESPSCSSVSESDFSSPPAKPPKKIKLKQSKVLAHLENMHAGQLSLNESIQ